MTIKLFILLIFVSAGLTAQDNISLETCWEGAREQMPLLRNGSALVQLDSLEQLVLKSNFLPQLNVKAQASWQSDVVGLDIPIPGFTVDGPDQEQYKAYIEVNQLIWDGGRTKALRQNKFIESQLAQAETKEAFYAIKQRVASFYFALMLSQQQIEITQELMATLDNKLLEIEAGVAQGVVREAGMFVLQAEKIKTEQDLSSQLYQTGSIAKMINVLTGLSLSVDSKLQQPVAVIPGEVGRTQLDVFKLQTEIASQKMELLKHSRMPVLSAFGQAGYGNPGLNMLKSEADGWLMAGVAVSWNIFDWNKSSRQREQLTIQQEITNNNREQFLQQISVEQCQYESDIEQYGDLLEKDIELVALRQKITSDYSSQFNQGAVTSSAYIDELFKEQAAKITQEIHRIKLIHSQVRLQILLEK